MALPSTLALQVVRSASWQAPIQLTRCAGGTPRVQGRALLTPSSRIQEAQVAARDVAGHSAFSAQGRRFTPKDLMRPVCGTHGCVIFGKLGEQAVALKMARATEEHDDESQVVGELEQEHGLLSRLQNVQVDAPGGVGTIGLRRFLPGVLPLVALHGGVMAMPMEDLSEQFVTLDAYLSDHDAGAALIAELQLGLECLLRAGVLHGDLHAQNVMVHRVSGAVKFLDLGFAECMQPHDAQALVLGVTIDRGLTSDQRRRIRMAQYNDLAVRGFTELFSDVDLLDALGQAFAAYVGRGVAEKLLTRARHEAIMRAVEDTGPRSS